MKAITCCVLVGLLICASWAGAVYAQASFVVDPGTAQAAGIVVTHGRQQVDVRGTGGIVDQAPSWTMITGNTLVGDYLPPPLGVTGASAEVEVHHKIQWDLDVAAPDLIGFNGNTFVGHRSQAAHGNPGPGQDTEACTESSGELRYEIPFTVDQPATVQLSQFRIHKMVTEGIVSLTWTVRDLTHDTVVDTGELLGVTGTLPAADPGAVLELDPCLDYQLEVDYELTNAVTGQLCNDPTAVGTIAVANSMNPLVIDCRPAGCPPAEELVDDWQVSLEIVATHAITDCNLNGVHDTCELVDGTAMDCNGNGTLDECDIAAGSEADCNLNGVIDFCEDCNANGQDDDLDIALRDAFDCNGNGIPDSCDLESDVTGADGTPDGKVNVTDLLLVLAEWGPCASPECPADIDGDGQVSDSDLNALLCAWGDHTVACCEFECVGDVNGDLVVDRFDLLLLRAQRTCTCELAAQGQCELTADFNCDCVVDDFDETILQERMGPCLTE